MTPDTPTPAPAPAPAPAPVAAPAAGAAPPAPPPAVGWTEARKVQFLERLSAHGNARAACRAVGLSAESAYKLRRREPLFGRAWAAAVVLGRDNAVQVLGERAVEGVEEDVYYRGELVGTRRRYDSRLLLAHLARLDRLADDAAAGEDAGRFDELLASIAQGCDDLSSARADRVEEAHEAELAARYDESAEPFLAAAGETLDPEEEERFADALIARCTPLAERAGEAAGREWDRAMFVAVDACLAEGSGADGRAPGSAPPHSPIVGPEPSAGAPLRSLTGLSPCTLSTVSTAALAAAFGAPPPWQRTPSSPFAAPRRPASR